MTWLDLLLEFMKAYADDLIIIEQCSSILAISAGNIKHKMPNSRYFERKNQMERQLIRLCENYPY